MQPVFNTQHRTPYRSLLVQASALLVLFLVILQSCQKDVSPRESPEQKSKSVHMTTNLKAVDLQLIAQGLVSPLNVEEAPDGSGRLFITDQIGLIRIVDAAGNLLPTPFLDLRSRMIALNPNGDERGLIGFTFHPDFATNGRVFVHYQAPPRPGGPPPTATQPNPVWNNLSKLSEFRVSANPNVADASSERVILQWDDPQSNHNGGTVAFGADGYLYFSLGDGGGANDVGPGHVEDWYPVNAGGNGQDIEQNLFGSIIRIDVNSGSPYSIPPDNPFVGKPGLDEIYAYGLRNPYRFSFDMSGSRRLFLGDAGQLLFEEINVIEKGGNYGWNVKEGFSCFNAAASTQPLANCPDVDVWGTPLTDPVMVVNNFRNPVAPRATTVIGGNVYRGNDIPGFQGKYIFGTFSQTPGAPNAELFITNPAGPGPWAYQELTLASRPGDIGYYLKGFGQDLEGEVYLSVSSVAGPNPQAAAGKVFKLILAE
jgi:glucose/arabinose dehydrogenase